MLTCTLPRVALFGGCLRQSSERHPLPPWFAGGFWQRAKSRVSSSFLPFSAQVILYLVVVPGKIKGEQAFVRDKNQPPSQTCATLVNVPAEFSDGKAGVGVRISKALQHQFERLGIVEPHSLRPAFLR